LDKKLPSFRGAGTSARQRRGQEHMSVTFTELVPIEVVTVVVVMVLVLVLVVGRVSSGD
jgi:hypothetical protein